jgi:hypothetical protein
MVCGRLAGVKPASGGVQALGREFEMILSGLSEIDPLIAVGVAAATAATDAVYVMFSSAIQARKRIPAATWSSLWYLLSSFAVINYTQNWHYVLFAAAGSWLGAYASMTFLRRTRV